MREKACMANLKKKIRRLCIILFYFILSTFLFYCGPTVHYLREQIVKITTLAYVTYRDVPVTIPFFFYSVIFGSYFNSHVRFL